MPDSATNLLEPPAEEITDIQPDDIVASDLLVEEISIDGMCGVY